MQFMRGRLWKVFLRGSCQAEVGAYNALVAQALAPQYQNSKVSISSALPEERYSCMCL